MAEYAWNEQPVIDEIKDFDEEVFVPVLEEILNQQSVIDLQDGQWVFIDTTRVRHSKSFAHVYYMHSSEASLFLNKIFSILRTGGARNQSRGMLKIRKDDLVNLYEKKKSKIK